MLTSLKESLVKIATAIQTLTTFITDPTKLKAVLSESKVIVWVVGIIAAIVVIFFVYLGIRDLVCDFQLRGTGLDGEYALLENKCTFKTEK